MIDNQIIWDFWDKQQKEVVEISLENEGLMSTYQQGLIVAYRNIQYLINQKTSNLSGDNL